MNPSPLRAMRLFGALLAFAWCAHCGTSGGGGGSAGASCSTICAHLATGMCMTANPTCESTCIAQGSAVPTTCGDLLTLLKACRATAAVVCDASGNATTPSCAPQQMALDACVADPPAPVPTQQPPSAATCDGVCARVNATCPTPTANCVSQCNTLSAGPCGSQWSAALRCTASATIVCSTSGRGSVRGCDAEGTAFSRCMNP